MNCSTSGLPVHPHSWSSPKPMSIESVMPSNHLIICHPLLLLASIFPSIRVFSNKSALRIYFLLFCIYHTNPDLMTFTNFFGINNDSFIISFNPSFFMACSLFITLLYLLHSSFCHTLPRIPQATCVTSESEYSVLYLQYGAVVKRADPALGPALHSLFHFW